MGLQLLCHFIHLVWLFAYSMSGSIRASTSVQLTEHKLRDEHRYPAPDISCSPYANPIQARCPFNSGSFALRFTTAPPTRPAARAIQATIFSSVLSFTSCEGKPTSSAALRGHGRKPEKLLVSFANAT